MSRTDYLEWASSRVERVEMKVVTVETGGATVPTMAVEIHYSWKSRRFSKLITSVLN